MRVKKTLFKLLVAAVAAVPVVASAQTSSINAFSPYTMYGIGELNTQGTLITRSMGGAGVAMRNAGAINLLNPASYSTAIQKSFLFDFGVEGQNYYNSQHYAGERKHTAYNTFNFHDIAFQLPVSKKLGFGFSLTPYSSVGYRTQFDQPYDPSNPSDDDIWGNVGRINYAYQGEGDVTEVKFGLGWEIFKNFSVGVAAQYYWGDIDRSFVMTPVSITGDGTYVSTVGIDNYGISSFKGQIGVQWNPILDRKRMLTVGATYDFGGDLSPEVSKRLYVGDMYNSLIKDETESLPLVLPRQVAVGLYYQVAKWSLGLDYVYQNWGGVNSRTEMTGSGLKVAYANTSTVKFGVEFIPNRYDVRRFFNRWSYRAGFRYGDYNQIFGGQRIAQYAVTLGVSVPVKFLAVSAIDVGLESGQRGGNVADRLGLVKQQYFKFAIGFTLFAGAENGEYWFLRQKYD